jgi:hypothetical protein
VNWHNGIPLGYDSYYYVGWINQAVSHGPLQFAASQHYVEFLYPIVASIPVYLGVSANAVEIVLPAVLACSLVLATGILARQSKDWRFAILTVAFSSGWFAVYRMGADFHGNLFAFPLLLLASTLLIRSARRGELSGRGFGSFLLLVVIAGAAHIETTDFFIAVWFAAFVLLGWKTNEGSVRTSSLLIIAGALVTSPLTFAYFQGVSGGLGGQYCVSPPYWLEVFGPAAGLAILGIGVAASRVKGMAPGGDPVRLVLPWSVMAIVIGVPGYITQFPIVISDRSLLLFPLPLVAALGTLFLLNQIPRFRHFSQTRLMMILAIAIPILTVPVVFSYTAPHFGYFAEHGPSLVTCQTG